MRGQITVHTRAQIGSESEEIELQTDAQWTVRSGKTVLRYVETPEEGSPTTVTVTAQDGAVTVKRVGEMSAVMEFADGQERECFYKTPFGEILLIIRTHRTQVEMEETGGAVRLWYDLKNGNDSSRHEVKMTVRGTAEEGRA